MINLYDLYQTVRISYHKYMAHRLIKRVDGELEKKLRDVKPRAPRYIYDNGKGMKCFVDLQEYLQMPPNKQILYKRMDEPIIRRDVGLTPLDEWHNNGAD